jgi:putative transposase
MHKTLKRAAIRPPRATLAAQQRAFHRFRQEYNHERPHQFLGGRTPGLALSTFCTIRFKTRLLYLSTALKQHRVGLEEVDDGIWSLYFCDVLLGRIDERTALVKGQLGVTRVPG